MYAEQILTILWLRWRLSVNQLRRGGGINAVIAAIVGVVAVAIALASGIAGIMVGSLRLANAPPIALLIAYDLLAGLFLFLWAVNFLTQIQRSEMIALERLLHMPVSLAMAFLVNYAASHLTLSVILCIPAMLGLGLALTVTRGPAMILMIPLALSLVFMISAWTYCLQGWLASFMINPRRRRAVIAYVTLGFILLTQGPNLVSQVIQARHRDRTGQPPAARTQGSADTVGGVALAQRRLHTALVAHKVVPVLWPGYGAFSLAGGSIGPALLAAAGSLAIGAIGLGRAYRSTVRLYTVAETARAPRPKAAGTRPHTARAGVPEWHLPGMSAEAMGLAQVFFLSLVRAPEIRTAMLINLIMPMIAFAGILVGHSSSGIPVVLAPFVSVAVMGLAFLGQVQLMFNLFGHDRQGFRAVILSPVPRRMILLGKNLALLPVSFGLTMVLAVPVAILAKVSLLNLLAIVPHWAAAYLLLSAVGNVVSCLLPYRFAPGSVRRTKTRPSTTVLAILSHLGASAAVLAVIAAIPLFVHRFLCYDLLSGQILNLGLATALALGAAAVYWASLSATSHLLERRERQILQAVTAEVE